MHVTNKSDGVRTFQVKDGPEDKKGNVPVKTVALAPGESAELDLIKADHPALVGMVESGELVLEASAPVDADAKKPDSDPKK